MKIKPDKIDLTPKQKERIKNIRAIGKEKGFDIEISPDNRRLIWRSQKDGREVWNESTSDYR